MLRRLSPLLLVLAALTVQVSPAAAARGTSAPSREAVSADHIGGSFQVCGRILEFTAPTVLSQGFVTVVGGDHAFVIDQSASVDPRLAALAAGGEWTCVHLTGNGGLFVDVAVANDTSCGQLTTGTGSFVLQGTAVPGSPDRFTDVTLDGDAAALIAADPDVAPLLEAIATVDGAAPVCLEFQLAADGTLSSIGLGYAESPASDLTGPIACGLVDGTPATYRDSASTPTPWDLTNIVSVDGFGIDLLLFDAPSLFALLVQLDAGKEVCLHARVVDSVIVEVAVVTGSDPDVCGALEVRGRQIYIDAVWVPTSLTALWVADVTNVVLGDACLSVRSQEGAAHGAVVMCETLTAVDDAPRPPGDYHQASFTASGVTFHLIAPIEADAALVMGTRSGFVLDGPDPFETFGGLNPAMLSPTAVAGCPTGILPPDTAARTGINSRGPILVLATVLLLTAVALGAARGRRSQTP